MVARAMSGPHPGWALAARGHRGQGDHLHGIVAEADALEGDAVDRTMVFADAAVGAAVIVDEDLTRLAAELLTEHGVADLDKAAARGVPVLSVDDHVQSLLRADVVAGAAENAGRLIDMVDSVALEAAQSGGDRLLVVPG